MQEQLCFYTAIVAAKVSLVLLIVPSLAVAAHTDNEEHNVQVADIDTCEKWLADFAWRNNYNFD